MDKEPKKDTREESTDLNLLVYEKATEFIGELGLKTGESDIKIAYCTINVLLSILMAHAEVTGTEKAFHSYWTELINDLVAASPHAFPK